MTQEIASISVDERFGFRQLSPFPSDEQLKKFYQEEYYVLLKKGSRAPELQRLTKGGVEAQREREWLHQTLYQDVLDGIANYAPNGKILDAGTGPGELVKLGSSPWWIAYPDHINYFNVQSLKNLCQGLGFDVIDTLCDFPMELFLLFGEDYVSNQELGSVCHQKRVSFELSIPKASVKHCIELSLRQDRVETSS